MPRLDDSERRAHPSRHTGPRAGRQRATDARVRAGPRRARPRGARRARAARALFRRRRRGHLASSPAAAAPLPAQFPDWFRSLRSIAREFRPDVAHTQSVRSMLMVAIALPRTPLVTTVHGIEESEERAAALLLRAGRARVTAVSEASAEGVRRHRLAPSVELVLPGVDIEATRARRARAAGHGDSRAPAARRVRRAPLSGQGRRRARRSVPAGARSRSGRRPRAGRRRPGHRRADRPRRRARPRRCGALRGPPAQPGCLPGRSGPRGASLATRRTAALRARGARTRARGRGHRRRRHARRRAPGRDGLARPARAAGARWPPRSSRPCSIRPNARGAHAVAASSWSAAIRPRS